MVLSSSLGIPFTKTSENQDFEMAFKSDDNVELL
jgi:hypothetical protein